MQEQTMQEQTIQEQTIQQSEKEQALMLVARAGEILVKSGAEIFRVETTMEHMAKSLHVESLKTYVIANGIFVTSGGETEPLQARITSVQTGDTDLGKIEAVNELSREMDARSFTVHEVKERLDQIEAMGEYPLPILLGAYGMGAGCFCYAVGGRLEESAVAFVIGVILGIFFCLMSGWKKKAKPLKTILGSMLVTLLSLCFYACGFGQNTDLIIIGGLMPMIPGVSFVNAVRDFVESDYVSGMIRLMDVLLTVVCMAIGVSAVWELHFF